LFRKVTGTATLDFAAKQGSAEIVIDAIGGSLASCGIIKHN
jgi:hypothetical protein